jgi:hypothetical protein
LKPKTNTGRKGRKSCAKDAKDAKKKIEWLKIKTTNALHKTDSKTPPNFHRYFLRLLRPLRPVFIFTLN